MKPLLLIAALLFGACAFAQAQPADTAEPTERAVLPECVVGDMAPNFSLKTFDDEKVVLSERFGEEGKPVVLLFSRANW